MVKIISYNIYSEGENYYERLDKILKYIGDEDPDIIVLQEVKYGSYDKIINYFILTLAPIWRL